MKITVTRGPEAGIELSIEEPGIYLIGRSSDCKLRLTDPEASRRHAAITIAAGRAIVDDQTSRNGTRVNDVRVQHAILKDGDVLRVGGTFMEIEGLAKADPAPDTTLSAVDPSMRVLASLDHRDADLLAGSKVDDSDTARENAMLRAVGEVTNLLVSDASRQSLLQNVLDHMKALLDADSACVMLWDAKKNEWTFDAFSAPPEDATPTVGVSRTIINHAVKDGMALLTENALADDRFGPTDSIMIHNISSALCAPMTIDEEPNGALCISRRSRADAFTQLDLRFTATIANILGVYLEKLRIQDEYIKQERLAAVGQVIAGLAHYAKNIITGLQLSVAGMQRMLKRDSFDSMETCVDSIAAEERRLTNLILDMLSYAKDHEPMRLKMDVNGVVGSVVSPFESELDSRSIRLEQTLAPDLPTLMAEKNALHRVFLNLFVNAMDALDGVEGRDKVIRVTTALSEDGKAIEVAIWDSGCGIPASETENIFGVFFSTKGSRGTGLGLAVSRKIIEEHRGAIAVESQEGKWTQFRIRLPVEVVS